MLHQSLEKLRALRLTGMARALEEQLAQTDIGRLSFDERLAMLIDREEVDRHNAALAQRLRLARLRQAVCLEDLDYRMPGGLDRALIRSLATGRWLQEHNNVLVLGPTGAGKSFIACALGNQAARDGHSVRYQRLSRLLDELAMGRAEGRYASLLARLSKVSLLILDDCPGVRRGDRRSAARFDGGDRRPPSARLDPAGDANSPGALARPDRGSHLRRCDPGPPGSQRLSHRAARSVDAATSGAIIHRGKVKAKQ